MVAIALMTRSGEVAHLQGTPGFSLMEAIREAGIDDLEAACGGCCSCATCHVFVEARSPDLLPPVSEDEDDLLNGSRHRRTTSRLSCQVILSAAMAGMKVVIAPAD